MQPFPNLSLVLGGVASGKSGWAERLVKSADRTSIYLATAQPLDREMTAKIAQHRADRGDTWQTIEAPLDLSAQLAKPWQDDIILVDCLTMWLTNHLLAQSDLGALFDELLDTLTAMSTPVVFVSNEVGQGGVPDNALARAFQREQGRLNQLIAQRADLVVAIMAGLPMVLKGQMPGVGI